MAPKPHLRKGNGAPEAPPRQGAPVTSDLARGVAPRPPIIRPSSKDGRPDLVRARCKTPSEDSSNKLQKVKSSRKTGQPVLSVGSNHLRSGTLASDKTSRDEVLDDGQSKSRATSTSREREGSWDEDSSSSQPFQPFRTVEVVGQLCRLDIVGCT